MPPSTLPLSPAREHDGLIFLSGQLGFVTPGVLVEGSVEEQTHQVIANIKAVLEAHGAQLSDILKSTIWLTRVEDFALFNKAYQTYFAPGEYPARSTVVSSLVIEGALIEIEVIARRK